MATTRFISTSYGNIIIHGYISSFTPLFVMYHNKILVICIGLANNVLFYCNSSAFGFLLRATPTFKQSLQRGGCRLCLFTLSSMTNQQGDWSWGELLRTVTKY